MDYKRTAKGKKQLKNYDHVKKVDLRDSKIKGFFREGRSSSPIDHIRPEASQDSIEYIRVERSPARDDGSNYSSQASI
jgi:hypothetical protein